MATDAGAYLSSAKDRFDIAFLDPPYGQKLVDAVLPRIAPIMRDAGIIICETDKNEELPGAAGDFEIFKIYRYGKAKITTYRKRQEEEK